MTNDKAVRQHLLYLLNGDGAHLDFETAIKDLLPSARGKQVGGLHSPWEILEHLRIAQRDILESIQDSKHVSPDFPVGYWPNGASPSSERAWNKSADAFRADFRALVELVETESTDLLAPLPNSDGQPVLRKALSAADHNAYHLGQLLLLKQLLA
jgi:hypothetical protein